MDGFKKVSEDKNKTVLKHENGHEITIAHGPLSHKMRSQLKSLPMSEELKSKDTEKTSVAEPTTQNFKGNLSSLASTSQALAPDSAVLAKGGRVSDKGNPKLQQSHMQPPESKYAYANEGNSAMPGPSSPHDMAEGGKLDANARKHIAPKNFAGPDKSYPIEDANHARNALARVSQHGSPELQEKVKAKVHAKYPGIEVSKMADGGQAEPTQPQPSSSSTPSDTNKTDDTSTYQVGEPDSPGAKLTKYLQSKVGYADGGDVTPPADGAPSEPVATDRAMHIGSVIGHAVRTALGDTADAVKSVAAPIMSGAKGLVQGVTGADQAPQQPLPPPVDPQLAQASKDLTAMQQPTADAAPTAAPQPTAPEQSQGQQLPQPTDNPNIPGVKAADQPTLEAGYANQMKGINQQAAAQGNLGNQQAALQQQAAVNQAKGLGTFQQHEQDLNQERQSFIDDIRNQHIDPNHYMGSMDTGKKIATGIGLILGGMGSGLTHQANPVLQMLNNNIDRDIDAQKANLGKSQSLLQANLHQYGNLIDATNATRIQMHDIVGSGLDAAAARAQAPAARAAALQAKGLLQQQVAPLVYQLNMRRTLMGIAQGGAGPDGQPVASNLSGVNPARFIATQVPEAHQSAVSAEVERAQNTHNMAASIKDHYNAASNAMSGLGHLVAAIREPREVQTLAGLLNTTVTDLTGTARQAEFDNVKANFLPRNTDTPNEKIMRSQALDQYLQAKSSAPQFEAYTGVPLSKFQSTNNTPAGINSQIAANKTSALTPQQQSFAKYAEAHPGPKSDLMLRKLGLK